MPNLKDFKNRKEYNKWFQDYRDKNREKIRTYNREYQRNRRNTHSIKS